MEILKKDNRSMHLNTKYAWIFPFIGSIMIFISFLSPAAYFIYQTPTYHTEFFRWMLDFYVSHVYEYGVHSYYVDINTSLMGYISLICSGIIIFSSVFVLIKANKFRKGKEASEVSWFFSALLSIISASFWMVMKEIMTINSFHHSFWGLLSPGFGIIGIFFGAGLEIIGYMIVKYSNLESRYN